MMMNKKVLSLALFMMAAAIPSAFAQKGKNEMVAYLFTYFNGNSPKQEQICYALSDDGYNYTPLNGGEPVIKSDFF